MKPHKNTSFKLDIVDFDESSLIEHAQVSNDCIISKSSLQSKFQEIEKKTIDILDYIIISIYLLNIVILSDDERNTEIIRIDIKFQVIEHLAYEYLIERNILKAYKIIIDENIEQIIFSLFNSSFHVFIIKENRYNKTKIDSRIFAARMIRINPERHL